MTSFIQLFNFESFISSKIKKTMNQIPSMIIWIPKLPLPLRQLTKTNINRDGLTPPMITPRLFAPKINTA